MTSMAKVSVTAAFPSTSIPSAGFQLGKLPLPLPMLLRRRPPQRMSARPIRHLPLVLRQTAQIL